MVLVERLRRIEMLCNTLKRMSKTWGLDSGAANCLTPPSFCWELQHLSGSWPAGWWFEEDDRGAAFGIRAWNKQALRQEGPVHRTALPFPSFLQEQSNYFTCLLPTPNNLLSYSSHSQLFICAHAHTENPISPSSFSILFVMLAARTLSHVLHSQPPGSASP